ncbi:MAG TPA: hypothetical protein VIY90_04475 [Steroidobacteraceae bacterium]
MSATVAEREAAYLEHRQRAKALRISLSEYCRRNDLQVKEWYQVRRHMVHKGLMARTQGGGRRNGSRAPATAFVPVRLTTAAPAAPPTPCLIRHPSGWMIECASLPAANWLNALVAGVPR